MGEEEKAHHGGQQPAQPYVAESEARSAVAVPASPVLSGRRFAFGRRGARCAGSQVDDVLTIVVASRRRRCRPASPRRRAPPARSTRQQLRESTRRRSLVNLANMRARRNSRSGTPAAPPPSRLRSRHALPTCCLTVAWCGGVQGDPGQFRAPAHHRARVVRPADIDATNSVLSARLAQLEVHIDGKGVVGDAIRRPTSCTD